jgi:hypothetical protein
MEERVKKAVAKFKRDPRAVPKKTAEAINAMGIKPNSDVVDNLAAKVLAVRQSGGAEAEVIMGNKALSDAARQRVEEYEAEMH